MDSATRDLIRRRAGDRCEYCLIRREHVVSPLHIDHIVAKQHRFDDDPSNLALACDQCNRHKGPNLAGIDPESGRLVALFHPRHDAWADHFALQGSLIIGLTPTGRATLVVLAINSIRQERRRASLIASGLYP
jgi:hypothetical protein